jgi:colicin import membrane protein
MALPENPGFAVSGGAHIGLLALMLLSFSQTQQLGDTQETIPVAVLSDEQFNQIMKGEKTAAEVKPLQRSEKIAETQELSQRISPVDAPKDVPASPSPLKRLMDPGQAENDEARPPQHSVLAPPPRPAKEVPVSAPKSAALKQSAPPQPKPPVNEDAEAAAAKPVPPAKPAEPAKKAKPKLELDQVAKLLDQERQKEKQKPAPKSKSGDEAKEPQQKFDISDIARFLNKEQPQAKQASGRELSQLASLGSPTASAAKMSPSLWNQLDGLLQEQYKRCWSFAGLAGQQKYIPEIHVQYTPDGALIGEPQLLNPPSDPNLRALAESAMRAVRRCDPLRIPAQYQPYYDQWKGRIVRFDPEEML